MNTQYNVYIYYENNIIKVRQPYYPPIPTPTSWTGWFWIELVLNSPFDSIDELIEDYSKTYAYYNYINKKFKDSDNQILVDKNEIWFRTQKEIEWHIESIKSTFEKLNNKSITICKLVNTV
jgi:hypothetical protein